MDKTVILMINHLKGKGLMSFGFPTETDNLKKFGLKFNDGGAHISRTMMLSELDAVLRAVPIGSDAIDFSNAILQQNVLGKTTDSTRKESLRRLRELYGINETIPIFRLLRTLHLRDAASLPLLAIQVVWARDPLFRATTPAIMDASEGSRVQTGSMAQILEATFPNQYSQKSLNQTARHAASSWTQSGHLVGRVTKIRQRINPTVMAVAMAFYLGHVAGYHGASVFDNPWCRLLDLNSDRAKAMGFEAHRAGLLNLRAINEIVELSFPFFTELQGGI